jgi:hypothetical protein
MNNAKRQAKRGTLKVIAGANTRKVVQRFFRAVESKMLAPETLVRLHNHIIQTADEKNLLIMLAAAKTGELKKSGGAWHFRGLSFITLRGDVPPGVYRRLTAMEIIQDHIPKPD